MTREEANKELCDWLEQMIQHGVPSHSAKRKALACAISALSAEEADGCLGCEYEGLSEFDEPCTECKNNYLNKWTTKKTEPSDLISRADAIKAVEQEYKIDRGYMADDYTYGFNQAIKYISDIVIAELPSVSVESKATENKYDCDLISERKEAKSTLLTLKHLFEDEQILKALDVAIECVSADRVGEWEYDVDADDSFCTNCHKYAIRDMEMQLESDFCPNCGARMENTK